VGERDDGDDRDDRARDPDLPRELAELAAAGREEWRLAREVEGREAAEHWAHTRSLRDAMLEWLHRGDALTVDVAGERFHGDVVDVGDDLLVLRVATGRVDVHVHPAVPLVLRPSRRPAGGVRPSAGPRTFRAALLQREGTYVAVGSTASRDAVIGRLLVARDHVRVVADDGSEVLVPLAAVASVRPLPAR
jgi:hypothetical protein